MAHSITKYAYRSEEEARTAIDRITSFSPNSESYIRSGPTPCKLTSGHDGWVIEVETYK